MNDLGKNVFDIYNNKCFRIVFNYDNVEYDNYIVKIN